jgi:hypothetical protein
MRRDAECCSVRCRQARHRFTTDVGRARPVEAGVSIRLAYADPPYPGLSKTYYKDHPDYAGEVDHAELIRRLSTYDGWALSTAARSLPYVLSLCPPGARVAAWVRGGRGYEAVGAVNVWEPVIYFGGRDTSSLEPRRVARSIPDASLLQELRVRDLHASHLVDATRSMSTRDASVGRARRVTPAGATRDAGEPRRVDALVHTSHPRTTDPSRVVGAKPAAFCRWMFDLLGAEPQDQFDDLFPGSGGVGRAWRYFRGEND